MSIEGKVIYINDDTQLAAADIGWEEGIVFEFPVDAQIDVGDSLEYLAAGYQKLHCLNATKQLEMKIQVLSGSIPLSTARFIVETDVQENALSQVA